MKTRLNAMVIVGYLATTCNTPDRPELANQIVGIYVREYSFAVINAETGIKLGMRTVRDSIFIRTLEGEYEVSNRKWTRNDYDYDGEGWRSMEHADDRPLQTFRTTFKEVDNYLKAESSIPLFLDTAENTLFNGKRGEKPYYKRP